MTMQSPSRERHIGTLNLYAWSVAVGGVGAAGAVAFRGLIAAVHNLLFLGQWSFFYDANQHTLPSPWGPFVILVPVLGAAGVAYLVSRFAPEAKGHGVPEVMDAIYYNRGVIRPIVAVIKSLASALSIGSGGSVGREGPIVQIGSSFASTLGQYLGLPVWQRITLIAAGAGAGIAATFNTPVGGVLFAIEIVLHEVSARTLVPVTIATVTASYVGRLVFGGHPSFVIPALNISNVHATDFFVLLLYPCLGMLLGLVSMVFIRSIYLFEDAFEQHVPGGYFVRHMLGMLGVGAIMYGLLRTTGHYHVEGVGYATVQDILSGDVSWLLLALFVLKLLTTALTLGSGASGGVFSPALFLGATFGGAFGLAVQRLAPALPIQPTAFAVAGMAGMVGGSTGAAMTAIVMIFEMTLDYTVIIPMTLTVALSYGVRKLVEPHSIYTLKLARRQHDIPDSLQANLYYLKRAKDIMESHVVVVRANASIDEFVRIASESPQVSCFLIEASGGLVGFLTRDSALRPPPGEKETVSLADLADREFIVVGENLLLLDVMNRMRAAATTVALVAAGINDQSNPHIRGVVTKRQIATAVIDSMEMFSD